MEQLDFLTDKEMLQFLRCNKTKLSCCCMKEPHAFLNQLRDYSLIPEELYTRVSRMKGKERRQKGVYEVLDLLESEQPERVKLFWRVLLADHILQQYPELIALRSSLLDGSFKGFLQSLDVVEQPERQEGSEEDSGRQKEGKKSKKRKEGRKRTTDTRGSEEEELPGLSSQSTPSKQSRARKPTFSTPLKDKNEKIWTWPFYKKHLPVKCGAKEGMLDRDKLPEGVPCILSEGRWFTPVEFETFGGKGRNKNWKHSVHCRKTQLLKLIKDGHLQSPKGKRLGASTQVRQRKSALITASSSGPSSSPITLSESEEEMDQEWRPAAAAVAAGDGDDNDEDLDLSAFQPPSLPVKCGAATGTLHKYRFASGDYGKCIRTEDRWMTPNEFLKMDSTRTDSWWCRDIYCHGRPLGFLLQRDILHVHPVQCTCKLCSQLEKEQMEQNNDDECFMCAEDGNLTCCDECPRSFHSNCHIPTLNQQKLGDKWLCTFCVLKRNQYFHHISQQEALQRRVSQRRMQCQYLLLYLYKEDTRRVFGQDPCMSVPGYGDAIEEVMYLDKMALKLQEDQYQTVDQFYKDIQLIFSNCASFNRDNEFGHMGARLKDLFEREFQRIFNIQ